jgi:riboflavin kinase / FMN adenylyltransferase
MSALKITPLSEVEPRPRHVAVGEFDGVHLGHRAVIAGNDTVLTFEPHPRRVVNPERAPKLLTSLELKAELIASLGVKELVVIPFDRSFADQEPAEFIDTILVKRLGATEVSVGENFRFGHRQRGEAGLLVADGRFRTHIEPLVTVDGETVSSTRIRRLLADGDVSRAARLLGDNFRMRGTVVPGDQRGRELGFPTANILPDPELVCPGHGVYACRVGEYMAAANVGVRPTFGNDLHLLVEPYLLDFTGDLYGQTLTLEFVERLRPEQRFDDAESLVTQMNLDVERTRQLLASDVA